MKTEPHSDMSEMDISHYLAIINRYKWSILTLSLLTTLLVSLVVFSITPMYKATTKLLIESQMPKVSSIEELYGVDGNNQQYMQTQYEILHSRRIAGLVVDKFYPNLNNQHETAHNDPALLVKEVADEPSWFEELFPSGSNQEPTVAVNLKQQKTQQLLNNLSIKPVMRTQIIDIAFVSDSPVVAAQIANAFAQAYIEDQLGSRIELTKQGTSWLFERMEVLKSNLQQSEKRMQLYMDEEKLLSTGGKSASGEGLSAASGRLVHAKAEFDQVKKRYGYKHPKYIQAKSELSAAQSALSSDKAEIRNIGRKEVKLRELKRQVESDRQIYDIFLKRMKESSQAVDYKKANARILDTALVPKFPFSPNKKRFILLAFIGGLFVGILLAFLNETLNKTIKSTEEVESKLGQANLGILPLLPKGKKGAIATFPVLDKTLTGYAESIRTIRTGLILSGLDNPHKTILVTSSVPGEGKSTVSTNLAMSMVQMEKVLLIGADMRRPSLHRLFSLDSSLAGLSELAAGTAGFDDCIQVHEESGLHVMLGGIIPPNPLELLSSKRFAKVLAAIEKHYDRIVIDSPPVQAVSDAIVLSTYAKAVVYVVEADKTHEKIVRKSLQRLLEHDAPLAGIVLNKVDLKKAEKYGYEYGGYYDQYGYGDKD